MTSTALTVREWQDRCADWITRFDGDNLLQRGLVTGEESAELLEAAVAVSIGVGRVQRCILKAEQDIRGGRDFWMQELRGELADVFFCLASAAHRAGFDLSDAIDAKWARIANKEYAKGATGA